jgi:hypothetical protein
MIVMGKLRTHDRTKPEARRFETRWCHLKVMPATPEQPLTDADIEELYTFAARLGLRRTYFQDHPHIAFRHYGPSSQQAVARHCPGSRRGHVQRMVTVSIHEPAVCICITSSARTDVSTTRRE